MKTQGRQPDHSEDEGESSESTQDGSFDSKGESDVSDIDDLIEVHARDWMDGLDRDDLMSLTIILLVSMLKKKITDISQLIAELTGKGEENCSTMEARAQFFTNKESFPDSFQGKYQRTGVLWHKEEMNKLVTPYIHAQENKVVKGQPNMHHSLLPNHGLEPRFLRKVSKFLQNSKAET